MFGERTEQEENAIAELRKRMKNDVPYQMYEDSFVFYKFLKARNFNMNQAENMLRKHLIWRREIQIDTIISDFKPYEVLRKYISQSFVGHSKKGYAVQYSALGSTDGRGLFKSANHYDVLRCIVREIEVNMARLRDHSKKVGKPVNQCVYIYDMENMTFAKATHKSSIEMFAVGVSIFQDNYPELLKNLYIINASIYFTMVFPVIRAIISSDLLNKIGIFGKEGWKEVLLKEIDADVLPVFLGGKRTDPDGNIYCPSIINPVGQIPEEYYLVKNIEAIQNKPDCQKLCIERRSNAIATVKVEKPNSVLNWEFEVKSHDIGFGLMHERTPQEGNKREVIPVHKVETELKSETGLLRCRDAGIYNIIFDNTYSWFYSKEVYYRTWVTDPEEKADLDIVLHSV